MQIMPVMQYRLTLVADNDSGGIICLNSRGLARGEPLAGDPKR